MTRSAWQDRLRSQLPTREWLEGQRWLRPLAHRLSERDLWRARPESLARGAAVGMFFAFSVPVAQFIIAAACCVFWRANVPLAMAVTLITNPLTIPGWLWVAYRLGSTVVDAPPPAPLAEGAGLLEWAQAMGTPVLAGMAMLAVGGAVAGYLLVRAGSWLWFHWRLGRRARRRAS